MSSTFGPIPPRAPIYLSGPQALHGSTAWHAAIRSLHAQFPGSPVWSPMDVFRSRADWLDRLTTRLGECGALVFLTDAEGWLGKGVDREIAAAKRLGLPIGWLTPGGDLLAIAAVVLTSPDECDWTRFRQAQPAWGDEVAR